MSAAAQTTIVVDIEMAAHKVLRDPHGLSGVAVTDLIGLAQFALQAEEEPRLTASMAAAIAKTLCAYEAWVTASMASLEAWERNEEQDDLEADGAASEALDLLDKALDALQTLFELEFPR